MTTQKHTETDGTAPKVGNLKKPYRKPVLTHYGDIRTKTLAPSPVSTLESGSVPPVLGRTFIP